MMLWNIGEYQSNQKSFLISHINDAMEHWGIPVEPEEKEVEDVA
jgi:hypothetical protein